MCLLQVLAATAASSKDAAAANDHASTSKDTEDASRQALASLSRSLDTIVDGLVNEQSTLSSDDAGPCLEYVVGHLDQVLLFHHTILTFLSCYCFA